MEVHCANACQLGVRQGLCHQTRACISSLRQIFKPGRRVRDRPHAAMRAVLDSRTRLSVPGLHGRLLLQQNMPDSTLEEAQEGTFRFHLIKG